MEVEPLPVDLSITGFPSISSLPIPPQQFEDTSGPVVLFTGSVDLIDLTVSPSRSPSRSIEILEPLLLLTPQTIPSSFIRTEIISNMTIDIASDLASPELDSKSTTVSRSFKEVLTSPSASSSFQRKLIKPKHLFDLTDKIPVKILHPNEWKTTSLPTFVHESTAIKETGCAKITINGVPTLTDLQSSISAQLTMLSKVTRSDFRQGSLDAYTYRFVEHDSKKGISQKTLDKNCETIGIDNHIMAPLQSSNSSYASAGSGNQFSSTSSSSSSSSSSTSCTKTWTVVYRKTYPCIKPSKFLEMAAKESLEGHFKNLPTVVPFTDDIYWSRVSSGANRNVWLTYHADIAGSILKKG